MMEPTTLLHQQEQIVYPNLPLAIYREIAAHLQQVQGIKTRLLPQSAGSFDYQYSQVAGLVWEYPVDLAGRDREQVQAILDYYARRYGTYQRQQLDA
jgi:hypothetical protein